MTDQEEYHGPATLIVPGAAEVAVKLSEPDPWGGVRLSGTGTPPWFGGRPEAPDVR